MNNGSRSLREERRSHQTRLSTVHVLDAAEEVFADRGFVGTTVRQIAERAEFSVGALYKLFPGGKEQLFAAVLERRSAEYLARLDVALERGGPAASLLHAVVDETLDYFGDRATFFRLYYRASGGDQLNWPYFQTIVGRYAGVFEQGAQDGTLVDDHPRAMALMLASLQTAYLAQTVAGRPELLTELPRRAFHELVDRAFTRV
jgi:AcrR family transcriptional regulator